MYGGCTDGQCDIDCHVDVNDYKRECQEASISSSAVEESCLALYSLPLGQTCSHLARSKGEHTHCTED